MSSQSTKQSGFSIVAGVIAAVLVIAAVGFIGWRLYNQPNKQTNDATSNSQNTSKTPASNNNQSSTPAQPVDPNAGYTVVKEWGVRLKPVSGLNGLEYAITNDTAQFTTSQLATLDPSCSAQNPVLGGILRSTNANVASSKTLGKVGNYYYYYYTPQGVCSDVQSTRDIQINTIANFKASLPSFEAAQ